MAQYGFYFDQTACTGCKCCLIACKDAHDHGVGTAFRTVEDFEGGKFPDVWRASLSIACNHCGAPACMAACPTGAVVKDEATGLVGIVESECTGCGSCVAACPYGAPVMISDTMAGKCDGCSHGYRQAKGTTACVAACSTRALQFGDVEELARKYGSGLTGDLSVLPDSSVTAPSLLIKAKAQMA